MKVWVCLKLVTLRNIWDFVVDRVMGKLAGWKAKSLSFVGRVVLVKSVMSAIPNYVMQGLLFQFTCVTSWIKSIETSFGIVE